MDFADFKLICNLMQTKNDLNKALVLEKILYIKSKDNIANFFTKALTP